MGKKHIFYIKLIFSFLIFASIFWFVYKNQNIFILFFTKVSPLPLFLSVASLGAATFLNTLALGAVLKRDNIKVSLLKLWSARIRTNMLYYIPGGIWGHAGLAAFVHNTSGASIKTATKAVVFSVLSIVAVGSFFVILFVPLWAKIFIVLFFLFSTLFFNSILVFINRLWKKIVPNHAMHLPKFSFKQTVELFSLILLYWFFILLGFAFFLYSIFTTLTPVDLILAGAAYIVAWVAGFLFIPAPSGLGIRELVLGALLSISGISIIHGVSLSLLFRVVVLMRDTLLFVFSYLESRH